ncbi:hypothetical protein V500_06549 [Pseudogymnoascus sp. VKM F-4518 (FW-2643)]|nr:hypothetical protein V500_06549 [Pseudogymnoascus sp. VKM F-4518 (FW-2643)]
MAGKPPPMMKLKLATAGTKISQNAPYPRGLSSRTLQRQAAASTSFPHDSLSHLADTTQPPQTMNQPKPPPLSILPLNLLLRNILISSISSSRLLLPPSLYALSFLANSHSPLLNPDRNPILRAILKRTFYAHFCAGETPTEVSRTITSLKSMGYKGVMLCYAREVVLDANAAAALEASGGKASEAAITNEILPWKEGTLKTVSLVDPGGFVAVKLTGAGSQALYNLSHNLPLALSPALDSAITSICDLAAARGVRLVFDAEQASLQPGIDSWTLSLMRRYNTKSAVVYSTYQAYLKACPAVLASHLAAARRDGFVAGIKLVRGAYINSDPRHLINDTKEDTDIMYDALASSVLHRAYNAILRPAAGDEAEKYPAVSLALASHNPESVRSAMRIQETQAAEGVPRVELVYGQLQGMADEVSCELVQRAVEVEGREVVVVGGEKMEVVPQAYKYLVWGTTGECMKYLARRAQENKDAVERTREGRDLMAREAVRRVRGVFGW